MQITCQRRAERKRAERGPDGWKSLVTVHTGRRGKRFVGRTSPVRLTWGPKGVAHTIVDVEVQNPVDKDAVLVRVEAEGYVWETADVRWGTPTVPEVRDVIRLHLTLEG